MRKEHNHGQYVIKPAHCVPHGSTTEFVKTEEHYKTKANIYINTLIWEK
jgi:hypothetical protein